MKKRKEEVKKERGKEKKGEEKKGKERKVPMLGSNLQSPALQPLIYLLWT